MSIEERINQDESRNPDGTFKPGVSGNPLGRPKGKTLKEFARDFYMLKSDEEKRAYIERLEEKRPGFAWEMGEGKAETKTTLDATVEHKLTPEVKQAIEGALEELI
jgi:hypothetical protein